MRKKMLYIFEYIADPPSVRPIPESGKLEVNLDEEVDMACVAKGVPVPIITWRNKVNDIFRLGKWKIKHFINGF